MCTTGIYEVICPTKSKSEDDINPATTLLCKFQ